MFWKIVKFELNYKFKQPFTYVFWALMFIQGLWYLSSTETYYSPNAKSFINSASNIYIMLSSLGIIGLVIACINTSSALYKDVERKMASIIYSSRVKEGDLFWGRFIGAIVSNLFIFTGYIAGAVALPWLAFSGNYGPAPWVQIGYGSLVFLLPTLFSMVCMAYAATVFTRHSAGAYFSAFLYMAGMVFAESNRETAMNTDLLFLMDPFGLSYILDKTQTLGALKKNDFILPLDAVIIQSRLLWTAIPFTILLISRWRFSFSYFMSGRNKKQKQELLSNEKEKEELLFNIKIPKVTLHYSLWNDIKRTFRLAWLETKTVLRSTGFILISLLILIMFSGYNLIWTEEYYSTTSQLPLTYIMTYIRKPVGFMLMIIIIVYAGEMFFKDRSSNMWQITDALPLPTWVSLLSRLAGMILVCIAFASWFIVAGVFSQIIRGYYEFEWSLYLTDIYLLTLPKYIVAAALALFAGSLVNNKYVGHAVSIAFFIFGVMVHELEISNQSRFQFTFTPGFSYSDINGHGHYLLSEFWFLMYWLTLGVVMTVTGVLIWNRGISAKLTHRICASFNKYNRLGYAILVLFSFCFLACNSIIYKNVNIVNNFQTQDEINSENAEYEKLYKKYESVPHPKITYLNLNLNLYPSRREAQYDIAIWLKNKTLDPVDSLHIEYKDYTTIESIAEEGSLLKQLKADHKHRHNIYALSRTLNSGDSLLLHFNMKLKYRGFAEHTVKQTDLVYNGTFLGTDILPFFGYNDDREVKKNKDRIANNLSEIKSRLPKPGSSMALNNNCISTISDRLNYTITVSTPNDQTVIAPGKLLKQWKRDGRNYFTYKSDSRGLYNFHIASARYEVKNIDWKNKNGKIIPVRIFYHPGHNRNIDFFGQTAKAMLDYCNQKFGDYPYSSLRIVEIPRYTSEKYVFDNTICIPEDHGWTADNKRSKDIDYIHYLLSKLISEQWFIQAGIQHAEGFPVITRSLSAYVALALFEDKYGPEMVQNHLEKRIDDYITGRGQEANFEPLLYKTDESSYVATDKGAMALFALSEYAGREKLDAIIKIWLDSARQVSNPPFLNPLTFYKLLKSEIPKEKQPLLTDLFERRVIYDNAIESAETRLIDSWYKTSITLKCKKMIDQLGNGAPSIAPISTEWLPIQLKNKDGEIIYNHIHRISATETSLTIQTKEAPIESSVDLFHWLIDKNLKNNTLKCRHL